MKFENGKIYNLSFKDDIINIIADTLMSEDDGERGFDSTAVVFPGKRPGVYLRKRLAQRTGRGFFPPSIYSLEEFMRDAYLSVNPDWREISMLDCAGIMYEILKKAKLKTFAAQDKLGFDAFLLWARKLAEIIEHADKECVPESVFLNIESNADIGYEAPEYVNEILSSLNTIRVRFHEELLERRLFTTGFLYKRFVEDIDTYIDALGKSGICLAGFYALNNSEKILFKRLLDKNQAFIIWQRKKDDLSDGLFRELEEHFKQESVWPVFPEEVSSSAINMHEAFDIHSEIKQLRNILASIDELDSTCIVLANEGMLIPLLFQVSDILEDGYNISLGYQIKYTALYTLVESIFNAQQTRNPDNLYYARDYLRILMHPFIKNIGHKRDGAQGTRIMVHKIEESLIGMVESSLEKKTFISLEEVEDDDNAFSEILKLVERMNMKISAGELKARIKEIHDIFLRPFENFSNMDEFLSSLDKALRFLLEHSLVSNYIFSPIVFDSLFEIIDQMRSSFYVDHIKVDAVSAFDLFRFYLYFEKIPFHGSPLKGTQILGLLETRSLNFKNVIVMDVNEDILPRAKETDSLLPMGIAAQLGLNTFNNTESVFRYHFFRLIESAESVHLLYRNSPSQRICRSRFIEEILWDTEKKNGRVLSSVEEDAMISKPRVSLAINKSDFIAEKTPRAMQTIDNMIFSSSSIDLYMHCPARFYFQYILKLREKEDLTDDIEARQIGNFLHGLLKDFYAPFKGGRFSVDMDMKPVLFEKLQKDFKNTFAADTAQSRFLVEVIKFKLEAFLKYESGIRCEREILYLEEEFLFDEKDNSEFALDTAFGRVPLRGIFDRVETRYYDTGEKTVIIDYKTGKIPEMKKDIPSFFKDRKTVSEYLDSVQMPLYLYLFRQMKKTASWDDMQGQFYSLKNMSVKESAVSSLFTDKSGFSPCDFMEQLMIPVIRFLLEEIKDKNKPFCRDDSDSRYCGHCPYSVLCKK